MSEKTIKIAKLITGVLVILLLLCQLFTFEKFPTELDAIFKNYNTSVAVAILLVLFELWSIPYLLGMKLPAKILFVSRLAVKVSLVGLIFLESWTVLNGGQSILFGATF
jgi:hypothetical protein